MGQQRKEERCKTTHISWHDCPTPVNITPARAAQESVPPEMEPFADIFHGELTFRESQEIL